MSARPTDVLFDVEVRDHADIEHDSYVDALIGKVERALYLRRVIDDARLDITRKRDDIRQLEANIGNAQGELDDLMGVRRG